MRLTLAALGIVAGCATPPPPAPVPPPPPLVLGTIEVVDDAPPAEGPVPVAVGFYPDPGHRDVAFARNRDAMRHAWVYLPANGRVEVRDSGLGIVRVAPGDEVWCYAHAQDGRLSEGVRLRVPFGHVTLRLGPAGVVIGRVVHGPTGRVVGRDPHGRAGDVVVGPLAGPYALAGVEALTPCRFGRVDADGNFVVRGVPPGRHRVVIPFPCQWLEPHAPGPRLETVLEAYGRFACFLPWAEGEVEVRAGMATQIEVIVPPLAERRARCLALAAAAGWPVISGPAPPGALDPDALLEPLLR